jgi:hypothetical protein
MCEKFMGNNIRNITFIAHSCDTLNIKYFTSKRNEAKQLSTPNYKGRLPE